MPTITDNFTGSDNTRIEDHTTDTGHTWSLDTPSPLVNYMEIVSNSLSLTNSSANYVRYASSIGTIVDGQIEATFSRVSSSGLRANILIRDQGGSAIRNGYSLELTANGCKFSRYITGASVDLKVFTGYAQGDTFKVTFSGSSFEFFRNGSSEGTATDSTYASGDLVIYSNTTASGIYLDSLTVQTSSLTGPPQPGSPGSGSGQSGGAASRAGNYDWNRRVNNE